MGYRVYGEEKDENEYPLTEFVGGFFLGGPGLYLSGAWVLSSFGLITSRHLVIACAVIGICTGCKFAWDSLRRKKAKSHSRG